MKKKQIIVYLLIIVLITGICIAFPYSIFSLQDKNRFGKIYSESVTPMDSAFQNKMSLTDKLQLIQNEYSNINVVVLEQGTKFNQSTIHDTVKNEVQKLREMGLAPAETDLWENQPKSTTSLFYIDTTNPAKNIIVWILLYWDGKQSSTIYIDDESGKILRFSYMSEENTFLLELKDMAKKWGEYLGLEFKEALVDSVEKDEAIAERMTQEKYGIVQRIKVYYWSGQGNVAVPITITKHGYSFG